MIESTPEPGKPVQPRSVPNVYCNGFQLGLSNADVFLSIYHNNKPILQLSLSYTTAKTLGQKLSEAIGTLEKQSGKHIMSIDDVSAFLKKELEAQGKTDESTG